MSLPNFDSNYDSIPGLGLLPTGNGWSENNLSRILIFGTSHGNYDLSGPVQLSFYAAVPNGGSSATVSFALADCNNALLGCTNLAEVTGTVTSTIADGFQNLTLNLGTINHSFGPNRRLTLLVITTTNQLLHTGYDSDATPSKLTAILTDS